MLSYYWEYKVDEGQLIRILSRTEKMSSFSNEGNKRIIFWAVQKTDEVECDGKALYNLTSGCHYIDVTFFYVAKDSAEESFIGNLSDDLLKQYCSLVSDVSPRDYYNYYMVKDGKVEAF